MGADFGPVFADDGEPDAVAVGAVGHEVVVAEGAFVGGSEFAEGGLRLFVLVVGLEGYAVEVEGVEGVVELEELGLGVEAGGLIGGGEPGGSDLDGAVLLVEIEEAGGAYGLAGGFQDGDPGLHGACAFVGEGEFDPLGEVGAVFDPGGHVAPVTVVVGDGFEGGDVGEGEGFEA